MAAPKSATKTVAKSTPVIVGSVPAMPGDCTSGRGPLPKNSDRWYNHESGLRATPFHAWNPHRVRSSPSAAAASRWSRATRCSTTTCSASAGAERPRVCFLPSASGDADHYVVRFYRAFPARSLRGQPHLALPPRAGARGPARAPALPGPDLRRRRQRDQPARRLAGARHRRDPARGVGGRGRPLRPLGRLAVLVRRGGDRLPRRAAPASRASASSPSATASTTSPARTGASPTTTSSAPGCAPATRPRTAPPCTSSAPS